MRRLRQHQQIQMPPTKTQFWSFNGGLDLVSPPLELAPSYLRSGTNVEIGINGGYSTMAGYERFSGKAKPSDAQYAVLTCVITGSVSLGDVLTDNAGTSFGTVIALPTGQAVLTLLTGSFATGNIKVGAMIVGTCTGPEVANGASTPALNATYANLAASVYRALIAVVPGSGNILGVWLYNGLVYAFRNNAGATAAVMHVQSAAGWVPVTLYNEVSFTVGSGDSTIVAGGTLAQGGVTSTIKRVVVQTGTLVAGTATGRLIITNPAGGNYTGAAATVGAGTLTLSGVQTAISFLPGGRFRFNNWNFGGSTSTKRMYGADGVNRGFEFDGTTLVPLATGNTVDTPTRVQAHKNQLFFAFGGSVQHSGIGNPYTWTVITGAGELACGDTIVDLLEMPGTDSSGALAIYTRNRTLILYGNDSTDWNLVSYSDEAGALAHTAQLITQGVVLDDQGLRLLQTTQRFGNFISAIASQRIKPLMNSLISTAVSSCIVRQKNQYRVFFSGGAAIYMSFKDVKIQGLTSVSFPNAVLCVCSLEGANGVEEIYFGSSDGYVYQMDIGTSFDGTAITWQAELAFNHCGTPRQLKQFRKGVVEVSSSNYAEFYFSYTLGYGSTEYAASPTSLVVSALSGSLWDTGNWDQLFWDGRTLAPSESDITGVAENISLLFAGSSAEFQPFVLNGEILHFTMRRQLR